MKAAIKGGGITVLVNNKLKPEYVTVKERLSIPDFEPLALSFSPCRLTRDIIVLPANAACGTVASLVAKLQIRHSKAFMALSGDLKHLFLCYTSYALTVFLLFSIYTATL